MFNERLIDTLKETIFWLKRIAMTVDPSIGEDESKKALSEPLTFEAKTDGTVIRFCAYNTEEMQREIEVSFDEGETWLPFKSNSYDDSQSIIAVLDAGEKILVRGDNPAIGYYSEDSAGDYVSGGAFWVEGQAYVYGNIMSLLNSNDFASLTSVPEYAFACQFFDYDENWTNEGSLFSHPTKKLLLPATTLANYCYGQMFNGCTGLTTAPELPATTLAEDCYKSMFHKCTSLTTAPKLPATTLTNNCYENMFKGCTSLTTAPELPATTLASSCYASMFEGCSSLTTAPELPATTLANGCYSNMFYNCTGLTTVPKLPATTLVSNCYNNMFYKCTSLNYIKALFTTTPSNTYTQSWVDGVSATGTFVKNAEATWNVTGKNGVPTGWTVESASE